MTLGLNTIWKFPLTSAAEQTISIPMDSAFLTVDLDRNGVRSIWMAIDPKSKRIDVEILKVATGGNLPHVGDYLGTVNDGGYIWHYFTGPGVSLPRANGFHYLTKGN